MCDMCDCKSSDVSIRKAAMDRAEAFARRLEMAATMQREIAHGALDPHGGSPAMKAHVGNIKMIIRSLVEDYV